MTQPPPAPHKPSCIALIHDGPHGFTPVTAVHQPLGGTQAATGYLAAALAARGHCTSLVTHIAAASVVADVACLPLRHMSGDFLQSLDVIVLVQALDPALLLSLRTLTRPDCRIFFWTGQAGDQPALASLHDTSLLEMLDGIWCVSDWQRQGIADFFRIDPARMGILRNAVAPAFAALAASPAIVRTPPLHACYTSTPFRGLAVLLDAFDGFATPPLQLNIFGGMVQYHQEDTPYAGLYAHAGQMPGCHVYGALGHQALAEQMQHQDLWLYPSIFAETSCINALEALAVGALPIVSTLGALPETLGDKAIYVLADDDYRRLARHFHAALRQALERWTDQDHAARIARQKEWILANATWPRRAVDFETMSGIQSSI